MAPPHSAWLRRLPPHRIRRYRSRSNRQEASRTRRNRYLRIALAALALAVAPLAEAHPAPLRHARATTRWVRGGADATAPIPKRSARARDAHALHATTGGAGAID